MIIRDVQSLCEQFSRIIHVLIPQDYGPLSSLMNHYVSFLQNLNSGDTSTQQSAMHILYVGIYDYLDENQDRALALLQHLGVNKIEFYNGELPIGVLEVHYEEEPV